jgi:hypothetical protein
MRQAKLSDLVGRERDFAAMMLARARCVGWHFGCSERVRLAVEITSAEEGP